MKIAFSGKGGVGKTTLAALIIRLLAAEDQKLLAIDADSNPSLAETLGFPDPDKIIPLIQMKDLIKDRIGSDQGGLYTLTPKVDDIMERFIHVHQGLKLISMGAIERGGGGCACPQNSFLKSVLGQIFSQADETIIIDMEAGLEQLGRGTAQDVDHLLIVVDQGSGSIRTARRIYQLADELKIRNKSVIANRVHQDSDIDFIKKSLKTGSIIGSIPYSEEILEADRKSDSTVFDQQTLLAPMRKIAEKLTLI